MGGGGIARDAAAAAGAQLPPHLMEALQHGMDEETLADMLGNIPADQAAELQRLLQEGATLSILHPLSLFCAAYVGGVGRWAYFCML